MSVSHARPRVAVFYGLGAASPIEVVAATSGWCDTVLLFDSGSAHGGRVAPMMPGLDAEVIDVAGLDPARIAACLVDREVGGVLTFAEDMMTLTAEVGRLAGLRYHTPATTHRLRSKLAQRQALNQAGVSPTRFVGLAAGFAEVELVQAATRIGFPVVVKPEYGTASRHTYRLDRVAQVAPTYRAIAGFDESFIVEELLSGTPHPRHSWLADYVSVEVLAQDGRFHLLSVTDKPPLQPPLRESGALVPSTISQPLQDELFALSTAAIRALQAESGVFHCELKLTAAGPRVIEVNGRLGGPINMLFQLSSDVRPIELAVQVALGLPVHPAPRFHRHALQSDVVPPVGASKLLAMPGPAEIRRIPGVVRSQAYVKPPAEVDSSIGELGRVLTAWIADEDIERVHAGLEQFAELCERTLRFS